MAGSVNKVILIGRLGSDPEMRTTSNGTEVANLSIATSEYWKNKDGQKEEKTEWHRIVAWSKLAELSRMYLSKGKQVYIEGKIQTRSWDDKSGQKRYTTEVVANSIQFLSPVNEGMQTNNNNYPSNTGNNNNSNQMPPDLPPPANFGGPDGVDDDVPF